MYIYIYIYIYVYKRGRPAVPGHRGPGHLGAQNRLPGTLQKKAKEIKAGWSNNFGKLRC